MKNCKDVNHFLDEYLDGKLGWVRHSLFQFHLVLCPACRKYLHGYQKTIELTRLTGEEVDVGEPPAALVELILSQIPSSRSD